MKPVLPEMRRTGSSNVATTRREIPKMLKNSFQNVCLSACSRVAADQSLEKVRDRWRISFQEMFGIQAYGTTLRGRAQVRRLVRGPKAGTSNGRRRSLQCAALRSR